MAACISVAPRPHVGIVVLVRAVPCALRPAKRGSPAHSHETKNELQAARGNGRKDGLPRRYAPLQLQIYPGR